MPRQRHVDLTEPDELTLVDYLGWLRRRWWILVAGTLVGLAAAAGFTAVQPRAYTSTTSVLVRQIGPDANPNAKVNLDTEAQVIRSSAVATRAQVLMRTEESPQSLVRRVRVTIPPNAQTMNVSFEADTAERARDGSHSFAQAYLDLRVDIARRDLETEIAALQKQVDDVNRQLSVVAGKIAALQPNTVDRQRAEADRNVLIGQLANLNARLSPLLATPLDPGSIITDAPLPTKPSSPNRTLNLGSGFGAGLLLGIALALLLDRLDTRVRRGRDIADRLGLPVLLEVPDRIPSPILLPAKDRLSRELGRLRNVLLTTVADPPGVRGRLLLLSAATPGAATGFVVGNLAAAYARTGAQVAVLSTNPNSPLARMVGADARFGLADVLRRDVTALQALTAVPTLPQLRVLVPGNIDPEAELPVAGLLEVLAELSGRFDHVLIETPPPAVAVEAQALSSHVDAVILIAEARHTDSKEISTAVRQFEQVNAEVIGAVLVSHMSSPPAKYMPSLAIGRSPVVGEITAKPAGRSAATGPSIEPAVPVTDSTMVLPRVSDKDSRPWADGPTTPGPGRPGKVRTFHGDLDGTRVPLATRGDGDEP
jgi:capsular polysaccharide biosynthesis protein/Mrp family chromosome partitioning ATPase